MPLAFLKQITDVIDANGNTTLVDYDLLGRRILIDNPDTGATQYQYDKAGNLTHKITANAAAKGESINYLYDRSRLTDIQYPQSEHNIHYDYGTSSDEDKAKNQQGRIKSVQHSAGIESREYGTLGETTLEQFTVTAVRPAQTPTYITQYEFDTFGRLMNLQYPNGEVLTHHYDSGGNVDKISGKLQGQDYNYLQKLHYDQFEQRQYMELGNGTKTSYDYKPLNRRLQNLQTEGSNAGKFQNISYSYDKVGNITQLSNKVDIARASDVGGPTEQNFGYDKLHRLITANGQFSPSQTRSHYYTLDMAYDGIHNIKQKRQTHSYGRDKDSARLQRDTTYDWQYGYDAQSSNTAAGPHAPTSIDTRDFHYDANGNQTGWNSTVSGQKRTIIWDDENRIREINDPGNTAWYSYDDEGQRKIKRGRYGETVYVNQFLTVRDGALATQHVYAGNTRVVSKLKAGKPIGKSPTNTKQNNGTNPTTASASNQSNASSNNGKNTTATTGESNHPGQGLLHRSDRANEVAQNTVKNPNLINAGEDDTGEEDTGTDTGTDDTGEDTDTGDTTGTLADIAYDFTGGAEFLYYYHPDHLGSTGFVTDNKGELYEHIEYFPFGETWVQESTSTWKVPYMYTGKELDEDTQLYYYGARYYDPRTSVWQSADPILGKYLPSVSGKQDAKLPGNGGVFNLLNLGLYSYAHQNPVKLTDPDGNVVKGFTKITNALLKASQKSVRIMNKRYAGTVHPDTGIPYNSKGFPDFSSVAKETKTIKPTGDNSSDFSRANKAAHLEDTPEGFTWHHVENPTLEEQIMQLVPTGIHKDTRHTGGMAMIKKAGIMASILASDIANASANDWGEFGLDMVLPESKGLGGGSDMIDPSNPATRMGGLQIPKPPASVE